MFHPTIKRTSMSLAVASACGLMMIQVHAQQVPAATSAQAVEQEPVTVVVTGIRAGLNKSIDLKRDAIGVRDSIVAEDIGKFPEQNIADALARLPGIEVLKDQGTNEGQRIQMRGLPAEYTVTLFNGAPVRATSGGNIGSATRDFNYDIFPSELFSRVDVYKTPLAELEEGGAAGVVNMQTPRPFDYKGRKVSYTLAGTKNTSDLSTSPRGQFLFSETWGNVGFLIQGTATKASQGTAGFASTGHFSDSRAGTSLAAPAVRQFFYDLNTTSPLANLGSYTAAQVNSAFLPRLMRVTGTQSERERFGMNTSLQFKNRAWNVSLDTVYAKLETQAKTNILTFNVRDATNANALIPRQVNIDANNMLSGTFDNFQFGTVSNFNVSQTEFLYNSLNAAFRATDDLKLTAQVSQNKSTAWRNNTSVSIDNTLQNGFVPSKTGTTGTTPQAGVINRNALTFDLSNPLYPSLSTSLNLLDPNSYQLFSYSGGFVQEIDKQRVGKLGAEYKYELFGLEGNLKAGLSRVESQKTVDQRTVANLLNGLTLPNGKLYSASTLFERAEFMRKYLVPNEMKNSAPEAGDKFPKDFLVVDKQFSLDTLHALEANAAAPQNLPASFNTVEKVTAFYLQTDLEGKLLDRTLRGNIGIRRVNTDVVIDNYQTDGKGGFAPANRVGEYSHTLPSASIAYDVIKDVVLRASVGKTFKRSSVSLISKTYGVRGGGGDLTVDAGNPELLPEEASSRDWGAEWYFAKGGILAVSSYNKTFTGRPVSSTKIVKFNDVGLPRTSFSANLFTASDNPDVTVFYSTNADKFSIKGTELAYQQAFTFLPAPFNGLGVYGSFTKNQTLGATRTFDGKSYVVPLVPENTYSISGYFEQGPWFVRAAFNHKSEWANTDSQANLYGFQRFFNERGYMDASVGYKFSKALEVRFDASNITNAKTYEFFRNFEGKYGDEKSRLDNAVQAGRGYSVSLRGSF
jgi:iron complex outermembrane receptor protein